MMKISVNITLVGAEHFHAGIVQCSGGGADGKNRQAVHNPQDMEDHEIIYKVKKTPNGTFDRK